VTARHRTLRTGAAAVGAAVVLALGAGVALAAGGVTGNAASIALYRAAAKSTNSMAAYVQRQSGYVQISDSLGPKKYAHWAWGWDQFQKGYHPATERITLVQHDGRVAWIEDVMSASTKNCHAPSCRDALPIELLITATHAYSGIISSGSTAACFNADAVSHVPYSAGVPWWIVYGDYRPAHRHGSLTEVTSTYKNGGQALTESDWITTSTKRFTKSVFRIAKGHGHPGYTFRNADAALGAAPKFPTFSLCPPTKKS
jgi:hypothetical protein